MNDTLIENLKQAIEERHECKALFDQRICLKDSLRKVVWEGYIYLFDLEGHAEAKRAYAWSSPTELTDKRRLYVVLEIDPVKSPFDAIRASIDSDYEKEDPK